MMEEIIKMITDNGIGIVCVGVVLYDHLVNNKKVLTVMDNVNRSLEHICNRLIKIETQLNIGSKKENEEE